MAQSLEVNIKTTSDVPQAMDKAKAATTGFGKQVEDIGKKFSTSFKDIFLSFLGPMAILSGVLAFIGKAIAENQRKNEEANQAAIDATNSLSSAEDNAFAKKRANQKQSENDVAQAKIIREQTTRNFINEDPRGAQVFEDYMTGKIGEKMVDPTGLGKGRRYRDAAFNVSMDKQVQDIIQGMLAEDAKKNPVASTGPTSFKTPEGFGNVVGVGANPVMEAMTMQLEESRKQTALLESLNNKSPGGGVPVDFTKPQPLNAASRSGSI
jgi:hypothetical protein